MLERRILCLLCVLVSVFAAVSPAASAATPAVQETYYRYTDNGVLVPIPSPFAEDTDADATLPDSLSPVGIAVDASASECTLSTPAPTVAPLTLAAAEDSNFFYGRRALSACANGDALVYAYDQIAAGIAAQSERIPVSTTQRRITPAELQTVFNAFIADYANYFWVLVSKYSFQYQDTQGVRYADSLLPIYTFTQEELPEAQAEFEDAAQRVLKQANLNGLTNDYDKALAIHDTLISWITYGMDTADANKSHTAYGALVDHLAVCDGYTKAYQYLLRLAGIPSHMAIGSSRNPSTGSSEGHAWNLVWLDGRCYHTDVTWNDTSNDQFYSYLNCSEAQILTDHQLENPGYAYPSCTDTADWYFTRNSASQMSDTGNYNEVLRQLRAQSYARVYLTSGTPTALWNWFRANISQMLADLGISTSCFLGFHYSGQECLLKLINTADYPDYVLSSDSNLGYRVVLPYRRNDSQPDSCLLIQGIYDAHGMLLSYNSKAIEVSVPTVVSGYMPTRIKNYAYVKFMLLDNLFQLTPLCPASRN